MMKLKIWIVLVLAKDFFWKLTGKMHRNLDKNSTMEDKLEQPQNYSNIIKFSFKLHKPSIVMFSYNNLMFKYSSKNELIKES